MKVAHFSLSDTAGAGGAAYELHSCMRQNGIDSVFFVRNKTRKDSSVIELGYNDSQKERILRAINLLYFSENQKSCSMGCNLDEIGIEWTKKLEKQLLLYDVFHLHWVTGLLSIDNIRCLLNMNKRVLWTVHDFHPFTAVCHCPVECIQFQDRCMDCNQLKVKQNKMIKIEWDRKKAICQKEICVIAASDWMKREVKKSTLFKDNRCEKISIGINENIFRIKDKNIAKSRFGFGKDEKVILFGAQNVLSEVKGYKDMNEIIEKIASDDFFQYMIKQEKLKLVAFGRGVDGLQIERLPVINVGFIEDRNKLCDLYNAADVFLFLSSQETFGMTATEAMFCGTPVIAYNVCAMKEIIRDGINGWRIGVGELQKIADRIIYFLQNKNFDREICRAYMKENYTLQKETLKVIKLYNCLPEPRIDSVKKKNNWEYGDKDELLQHYYTEIAEKKAINQIKNMEIPVIFDKYNPTFITFSEKVKKLVYEKKVDKKMPVIIFGAGNCGRQVCNILEKKSIPILEFWDNASDKWGEKINGYFIVAPKGNNQSEKRCIIIAAIAYAEIREQLIKMKYRINEDFF